MRKIESYEITVNKLTCLFNVRTERLAKSRLKKMRCRMVALDSVSLFGVDLSRHGRIHRKAFTAYKASVMQEYAVGSLRRRNNLKRSVAAGDDAGVTNLSAAFAVKRGAVKNKRCILSFGHKFRLFAVNDNSDDFAFAFERFVADKIGLFDSLCHVSAALPGFCADILTGSTSHFAVFFDKALELVLVNT